MAKDRDKKISAFEGFWYDQIVRRKRLIIVLAACVLVGIAVVAIWPGEREPEYKGKKLSEWIDACACGSYLERMETVKAIQAIGTNAVPWLLKWRRLNVQAWQIKLAEKCDRHGVNWPSRYISRRMSRRAQVWTAFSYLGPRANAAIPEVACIAISASPGSYPDGEAALIFLSQRPEAIPALLEVITQGKGQCKLRAIHFIGQLPSLGSNGAAAVAVLLKCLNDPDESVVAAAAFSLGLAAFETKEVVPALTQRLRDERRDVRHSASRGLGNLANNPAAVGDLRSALPEFILAQQSPDYTVRTWATNVIFKIAPEVLTNGANDPALPR